ncbi:DedA family protein [Microbacterium sp. NIBRBAC000506063]|uniref:DedA family protein n=1 Tax=Microbacterium sp. NIBRBAC000506063 TaxID=2734618 RepID=UPI001CB6CAAA|nr:VTT domain-containing protein [Microbacterium sp. NIBRBAC000506063]
MLFAVAVIDGFFPPVPSETLLIAAVAAATSLGEAPLLLLCAVAAAGAIIGDNIAYRLGRALGIRRFAWMRRPRAAAAFDRAQALMQGRGAPTLIFGARYIPVGRVAVNMSAGALDFPWRRFLVLSTFAGITWAVYGTALGVFAGSWLTDQPLLSAVIGVTAASGIAIVVESIAARRHSHSAAMVTAPQSDAPERRDVSAVAG